MQFTSLKQLALIIACLAASCLAAHAATPVIDTPSPLVWHKDRQGAFVICLTRDAQGNVWAGTEDKGVWRFDAAAPKGKKWKQFTVKDGLGDDNAYALTVDHQGRVWAGHLNHGVSVWNGKTWKNYGVLDGPLGERIFALTVDSQGDVWMATNAGLTRYIVQSDTWRHYTQADGLPSNAIGCLAADSFGNIYAGTQADGIAISSSLSDYKNWRVVKGMDTLPLVSRGEGLPSSLISDILVGHDDTLYVSTTSGLARSYDHGETWSFVRGMDWVEKANGLNPPAKIKREGELGALLREDYVTSLSEDAQGRLWIGYRQKGFEVRSPKQDFSKERILYQQVPDEKVKKAKLPYVSAILPAGGNAALFSNYGEGLQSAEPTVERVAPDAAPEAIADLSLANTPSLPSPLKSPTLSELQQMAREVEAVGATKQTGPLVVALNDDWNTQGDWLGRYGRYYARLCAMLSPDDYVWGAGAQPVEYVARIGPNADDDDSLRYWVHWLNTDNKRSLEMTQIYYHSRLLKGLAPQVDNANKQQYRRQAEIDDHGEAYPMSKDGPHLYVTLTVPAGSFSLSLYDFNKDGHTANNRLRDYRISIRAHPANKPLRDIDGFETWPELAHTRIRDFWGGVYKKFMVRGPQTLTIEVNRNYSFNTILAGVFLDELTEEPTPYFQHVEASATGKQQAQAGTVEPATEEAKTVEQLWQQMEQVKEQNPMWWASEGRRICARLLPWFEKARLNTPPAGTPQLYKRMGTCYYSLTMFDEWEKLQEQRGLTTAREIEKSLRWDGELYDETGKGRELITAYITAKEGLEFLAQLPQAENTTTKRN